MNRINTINLINMDYKQSHDFNLFSKSDEALSNGGVQESYMITFKINYKTEFG